MITIAYRMMTLSRSQGYSQTQMLRYWQTHLLSRYTVDQQLTNQQLWLETGCKDTDATTPSESLSHKWPKVISTGGWGEGGQKSAGRTEWWNLVETLKYNKAIRQSSRVPTVTPDLACVSTVGRQTRSQELNIPQWSLPIHSMYAQAGTGRQGDLHPLGQLGIPTLMALF